MERNITEGWKESARYWDKHTATLATMFAPITDAILSAAGVESGHRVLDVAGGTGEPALSIASLVGVRGLVVSTDVAPAMVRAARRRAADLDLEQIEFVECSGDALPFADSSFDRAVCRLGVMFFGAPESAVAQMVACVRPGGIVTIAVWSHKERNPFFGVVSDIVGEVVPSPPDPPGTPNAWRFADDSLLAGMFSGCDRVEQVRVPFTIGLHDGFEAFWKMRVEMSDSLRAKLGSADSDLGREVAGRVREALSSYVVDGGLELPAEVLIVSGLRAR